MTKGSKSSIPSLFGKSALQRARRQAAAVHEELEFEDDLNKNMDPGVNVEIPRSSVGVEVWKGLFMDEH